jgi:hypothetical protein
VDAYGQRTAIAIAIPLQLDQPLWLIESGKLRPARLLDWRAPNGLLKREQF